MLMDQVITEALEKGQPIIHQWGLLAIGGGILCETLFFAGLFIPGFSILVAAGFLAAEGTLNVWAAIGVAMLGGIMGDQTAYAIGRLTGDRFLKRRSRVTLRLREAIRREGTGVMLWYHFVSPMRAVMPYLAGSLAYPWSRWLVYDSLGLALWILCGFGFGYLAYSPFKHFGDAGFHAALTLVIGMIIFTVWRLVRMFRQND